MIQCIYKHLAQCLAHCNSQYIVVIVVFVRPHSGNLELSVSSGYLEVSL